MRTTMPTLMLAVLLLGCMADNEGTEPMPGPNQPVVPDVTGLWAATFTGLDSVEQDTADQPLVFMPRAADEYRVLNADPGLLGTAAAGEESLTVTIDAEIEFGDSTYQFAGQLSGGATDDAFSLTGQLGYTLTDGPDANELDGTSDDVTLTATRSETAPAAAAAPDLDGEWEMTFTYADPPADWSDVEDADVTLELLEPDIYTMSIAGQGVVAGLAVIGNRTYALGADDGEHGGSTYTETLVCLCDVSASEITGDGSIAFSLDGGDDTEELDGTAMTFTIEGSKAP